MQRGLLGGGGVVVLVHAHLRVCVCGGHAPSTPGRGLSALRPAPAPRGLQRDFVQKRGAAAATLPAAAPAASGDDARLLEGMELVSAYQKKCRACT